MLRVPLETAIPPAACSGPALPPELWGTPSSQAAQEPRDRSDACASAHPVDNLIHPGRLQVCGEVTAIADPGLWLRLFQHEYHALRAAALYGRGMNDVYPRPWLCLPKWSATSMSTCVFTCSSIAASADAAWHACGMHGPSSRSGPHLRECQQNPRIPFEWRLHRLVVNLQRAGLLSSSPPSASGCTILSCALAVPAQHMGLSDVDVMVFSCRTPWGSSPARCLPVEHLPAAAASR